MSSASTVPDDQRETALAERIGALERASQAAEDVPISRADYVRYTLGSTLLLVPVFLIGFLFEPEGDTYFRLGPGPKLRILGIKATTPGRYFAAMLLYFALQLSNNLLASIAGAPLISAVYSTSLSHHRRQRIWGACSTWSFYLVIPLYNASAAIRGGLAMVFSIAQVDVLLVSAFSSVISDLVLFLWKYAPPSVFAGARGSYEPLARPDSSEEDVFDFTR